LRCPVTQPTHLTTSIPQASTYSNHMLIQTTTKGKANQPTDLDYAADL